MKKKITVGTTCILVLLAVLLTFQITYSFVGFEYQAKVDSLTKTQSDFSLLAQADSLIRENYYDSFDDESVEKGLISGYVSALSDPYSKYLSADEFSRFEQEQSLSGTGVGLRLTWDAKAQKIYVCDIIKDSPAMEAGVTAGDQIVSVNGKSAEDLGFYGVLSALSAEEGSEITLDVKREIAAQILDMSFSMKVEKVPVTHLSQEWLSDGIAYIRIYSFSAGAEEELHTYLNILSAAQAKGIIFDVRNTADGSAEVAFQMLDSLLGEGILARSENEKGEIAEIKSDKDAFDFQLAVLINEKTSFAAEIFAVALKDFDKATLVGEKSFGKSIGQKVMKLDDGSALLLSHVTYTPSISPSFEKVGVEPDVVCKLNVENFYLIEKNQDSQVLEAMRVLIS